ncbi:LPS translocon maturation chaperone LptM [Polaromonas sp.]|uniref:LPS translocon maturation chaperone LptM n=1 Tax=Polaromonas sp. TaxID=1869339 RepID=UPI00286C78BD|nr:lipoprotein [Polaromonas sp.]
MVSLHQILGRIRACSPRHGLVTATLGAAALAACGQKGPLFLPVPPQLPVSAPATAPAPVAAAPTSPASPASAAR